MKINIQTDLDSHDCEICGGSYASGGSVNIDGKEIINIPAFASCFSSDDYTTDELLVLALSKLGHDIIIDNSNYHISCYNEEYHGKTKEQ